MLLGNIIGDVIYVVYVFAAAGVACLLLSVVGFVFDHKTNRLIEKVLQENRVSEGKLLHIGQLRRSGGKSQMSYLVYRITYSFKDEHGIEQIRLIREEVRDERKASFLENHPFKVVYNLEEDIYLLVAFEEVK